MLGIEFLKGQGLGNQLFCYVSVRAIAQKNGYKFGTANREQFANNIHNSEGNYFMNIDLGEAIQTEDISRYKRIIEKDDRIYIGNSNHDVDLGMYVTGTDLTLLKPEDNALIYGNLQSEDYFREYKDQIKDWIKIKPEYDTTEYSRENLCIINIRGGEYSSSPILCLPRKYWINAISEMKKIRRDMDFMIITDDVSYANKVLPEYEAKHFDIAKDYAILKNAFYLILSNSTFAFFPAYTSDTVRKVIAPKYWARHTVSNGYWASEQNIYDNFTYMDRKGKLYNSYECREELLKYKKNSKLFSNINVKPSSFKRLLMMVRSKFVYRVCLRTNMK